MIYLACIFILIGFGLQILVPLQFIDVTGWGLFGIPDQISVVLLGTLLILLGTKCLYFGFYRDYARRLDKSA